MAHASKNMLTGSNFACALGFCGPVSSGISTKDRWREIFSACTFFRAMLRYDRVAVSCRLAKDLFQKLCTGWGFRYLGHRVYIRLTAGNSCFPVSWLQSRC